MDGASYPVSPVKVVHSDVVVVGSGTAGMAASLALAQAGRKVRLLTKTDDLPGGSSLWAQGGVAVALGDGDSAADHAADTVAAGAGLTDPSMARLLAEAGIVEMSTLLDAGLPADRGADGRPLLGREAAHGRHRILHAGGDATGRTLVTFLAARVRATPGISIHTRAAAADLVVRETGRGRRAQGVLAYEDGVGWVLHVAPHVVLATGGTGQLWAVTTNPPEATGDGMALAARAGAHLADLEFVQFHPTALAVAGPPGRRPLLTEALRGAGAKVLDAGGHAFMAEEHPDAELAPRDVVARAIGRRVAWGEKVFLDLRPLWAAGKSEKFPTVAGICAEAGLDPAAAPVPVAPAAHYHMGGVLTDADGRTSIPGLWAAGEVACTHVHGANRLASNSLLEAVVFAGRVAAALTAEPATPQPVAVPEAPTVPGGAPAADLAAEAQRLMAEKVGLVRDGLGLAEAALRLRGLAVAADHLAPARDYAGIRAGLELRNRLLLSRLVVEAAKRREESRGAHTRADHPETRDAWRHHQILTYSDLGRVAEVEPATTRETRS
ncbi:L-aspartate oxidase [Nitrospirillum sp. BR 11163]|uniref:L-aspartate oxidase n=1 Tax=Nitrospirillum sp. BR 11163 TaxID=3104323 RepID=UPI002AFE6341|nr:L-aspartate oxidase [Nitrospirillum sp. BR 11163]MEA1677373.1 L-aspartate oxidase [Nitrospirillum sp. BR 11163]